MQCGVGLFICITSFSHIQIWVGCMRTYFMRSTGNKTCNTPPKFQKCRRHSHTLTHTGGRVDKTVTHTLKTSAKNPAPIFSSISKSSYWLMESTASLMAVSSGELGVCCRHSSSARSRAGETCGIVDSSPSSHTRLNLWGEWLISEIGRGEEEGVIV